MLYPYANYRSPSTAFYPVVQPRLLYPNTVAAPLSWPNTSFPPMANPGPSRQNVAPGQTSAQTFWPYKQQMSWLAGGLGGIAILGGAYWLFKQSNQRQKAPSAHPASQDSPPPEAVVSPPQPQGIPVEPPIPKPPAPAKPAPVSPRHPLPFAPHNHYIPAQPVDPVVQAPIQQVNSEPLPSPKSALMQRLFPQPLSDCNFKQGGLGDCTLLAALKATLHNNPDKISELFEPTTEEGVIAIMFKDTSIPQRIALNDFKRDGVQGPLGVQLLETAFGRHLKPEYPNEYDTITVLDEGGYADKAIQALTNGIRPHMIFNNGKPLGSDPESCTATQRALSVIEGNPAQRIAVASACKSLKTKDILANHAYAVLKVDTGGKIITLANPHHTERAIHLSFKEFIKHFRRLTFTRLH